jgi:hypothetical protein
MRRPERGWSAFEDELGVLDPDLFDPMRASIVPARSVGQ